MKRQLDTPGNDKKCEHPVQYQEKRYDSMIYQVCKSCNQALFVRKDKRAEMTG